MKISVAQSAGFCFGVKRAMKLALDAARQGNPVEMLGDIVHNEIVTTAVEQAGIKKVDKLGDGRGKTLLIRAHGASKKTIAEAEQLGYRIIDATCPMVKEIHALADDFEAKGLPVIIIGDRGHEEVKGIAGQLMQKAIIIESPESVPLDQIKKLHHAGVLVQSTQHEENVTAVLALLRKHIPEITFKNTICRATKKRQSEIKKMPLEHDVMFIVGSKSSANTKRLYELSKRLNDHTHWILTKDDIRPEWLQGKQSVGITAGASTPNESIESVVECIRNLTERT